MQRNPRYNILAGETIQFLWKDVDNGSCRRIKSLCLKILPSSHSSATCYIMVTVSMWYLPTTVHNEWCARYYFRNGIESYTFQRQNPLMLQPDVHTNIS